MKETEEQKQIKKENEMKQIEYTYNEYIIKNIPILEEWRIINKNIIKKIIRYKYTFIKFFNQI